MFSIGETENVFFCVHLEKCDVAAKLRMATEYIYKKVSREMKEGKIAK